MFERFTDRARRVLVMAREESSRLRHPAIGTEHFLLGLLAEGEGVAAVVLRSLGISLEDARREVAERVAAADHPRPEQPPFTARAKKVMEAALREALQLGHSYIGTEHLLLGLVREGQGVGAQVVVALGPSLSEVRQRVVEVLAGIAPTVGRPDVAPVEQEPLCPHCSAALEEHAAARRLMLGDDPDDLMEVRVVYCGACGKALAFRPEA